MGVPSTPSVIIPTTYASNTNASGDPVTVVGLQDAPGVYTASGAVTGGTYVTLVDLTSNAGVLEFAAVATADTTPRTVSIRITVDGVVVYADTSAAIAATDSGICAVGHYDLFRSGSTFESGKLSFGYLPFNQSLKIEITQSLSETDKIYLKHVVGYR